MAQRKSGYERQPNEFYATPLWPVEALAEHVALKGLSVWEPAAGAGDMVRSLEACGASVRATDLFAEAAPRSHDRSANLDFLNATRPLDDAIEAVITNPPFSLGVAFIEKALDLLRAPASRIRLVAFLLAVDFDSASTRTHLFANCPEFALKVVLLRRIRWFEGPSGPSTNHAWFVYTKPPTSVPNLPAIRYAPKPAIADLDSL